MSTMHQSVQHAYRVIRLLTNTAVREGRIHPKDADSFFASELKDWLVGSHLPIPGWLGGIGGPVAEKIKTEGIRVAAGVIGKRGLSGGQIAFIVIGAVVLVSAIAIAWHWWKNDHAGIVSATERARV